MPADVLAPMVVMVVLTVTIGATIVLRGALGKALADRIAGRRDPQPSAGRDAEVGQLREELDEVRGQLAELQERVDFTERVLAQQREPGRLRGGD
jgi:ubiquinone biosynthesis protein UbiJ